MAETGTEPYALVVDDDAVILEDASRILQDAGFRTFCAMDVEEAEALLSEHADAIIVLFTDMEMPGPRNGFDLARLCAERWPDIAVLVASGRAQPAPDLPRAAVFIRKPFSVEVVHAASRRCFPTAPSRSA